MFYYKIKDGKVTGKTTTKPRFEHVKSSESWSLGSECAVDQETGEATFSEATVIRTDEEVSKLRELAYSHVHTGTKKYFEESAAKRAMGDEAGALEAEAQGLARRAEIQAEYPFNED